MIFEDAINYNPLREVQDAQSCNDIAAIFSRLFGVIVPTDPSGYKNDGSDYGLKVRGVKAREDINQKCREILERVKNPSELTAEERAILLQYSGKGGLTDNSQWEYYTPTPLAQGIWGALKAHGFNNGNVLEPSCGAGVFIGTKPSGVVMTANDLDDVGSGVARLLNPDDLVTTSPFESVVMSAADDSFDSCVGNVPFGKARGSSMQLDPAYKNEKLPQAYFILRILDKIKPGGLACLVVPTDVVGDKGAAWKRRRMEISKRAEFLGAHKLPSSMFGGKGGQGTDTVTDVIVLRKHGRELLDKLRNDEIATDILKEANVYWDEFISGKYWLGEGKPFIMGKFVPRDPQKYRSRDTVDGKIDDATLKSNLARKFNSRINWEVLNQAEPIIRNYSEGDRRVINGEMYVFSGGDWHKEAISNPATATDPQLFGMDSVEALEVLLKTPEGPLSLTVDQGNAILEAYPHLVHGQLKNALEFAMFQAEPALRNQLYRGSIIGAMIAKMGVDEANGEDVGQRRSALQELVTSEITRYGHPQNNKKLTLAGASSRAFGVFMNSVDKEGNFSDLLAGNLDKGAAVGYNDDDLAGIVLYLKRQSDKPIQLEDIKKLYAGTIKLDSLADLADVDEIAITPEGNIEPASSYCSGDVSKKLTQMQTAIEAATDERIKAKYQRQYDRMNGRIKRVPIENITFGMQQKWYGKKYLLEFVQQHGYPRATYGKMMEVEEEQYDGTIAKRMKFVENTDIEDGEFVLEPGRALQGYPAQFEKYLNGDNVTSNTQERIQEYRKNVADTEAMFDAWMKQHVDSFDLAEKYTLDFNGYVQPEYDDSPLGIDDMISGEIIPHSYQNAEVRRLSEQGSGICGFGVGLGKSFTALATAAYNLKRGRAKRTCVVVPSAVLENWYHEARTFYSESHMRSNVLFVGLEPVFDDSGAVKRKPVLDENGKPKIGKSGQEVMQDVVRFSKSKEDIFKAMWKIPQSNFSLVVMTKEKFQTIPVRPETMKTYTDDMVKRGLMSLKNAEKAQEDNSKKGGVSYAEDVARKRLEQEFSNQGGAKKDELPYLEDMGFDSIITDESHFFKNSLKKGAKTGEIKGVPDAEPSKTAVDMAIKCDYMRRKYNGRGVYGLTATPVTNSPIEIYNMLSLVCPKEEFERMGVYTVDDFVRLFGDLQDRDRYNVGNKVVTALTLVGFKNLDGLRNLFHKYVNIKTVADVDDQIHVPNAQEVEEELDMTEEQTSTYQSLYSEAQALTRKGRSKKSGRSVFTIMREMELAATDMDMYRHEMTFVLPFSRKNTLEAIAKSLPNTVTVEEKDEETGKDVKRTIAVEAVVQIEGDIARLVVHEALESAVLAALQKNGIPEDEINHLIPPKYAKLIANLKKHLDAGGKQIVFTEEKTQHRKLKRICVHNLPIEDREVATINADDAGGDKLDKISKAYNAGGIKIVIANKKAEVGVNLQKGTTAIHHLTLPWTPASINQRNGRGVRQGNKVDTVEIYFYCAKESFDKYKKQILNAKANWIGLLLSGTSATAINADVETDEEMKAMVAGDIEEYRRKKAEAAKKREDAAKTQHTNRLKILQSLQASLATHDGRREEAKRKAQYEIEEQKRRIDNYQRLDKGEETIKRAKEKLQKLQDKLAAVDAKFDIEKTKTESQANQARGMLRAAAKKGELPFDASLIDSPENCTISLHGAIYKIGDVLDFGDGNLNWSFPTGLCEITSVNVNGEPGMVKLQSLYASNYDYRRHCDVIAKDAKLVSYSPDELLQKKLLAGTMKYADLPASGISKKMFLENLDGLTLNMIDGAVVGTNDGSFYLVYDASEIDEDMRFVWPEPENNVFQRKVWEAYQRVEANRSYNPFENLMRKLFGPDFHTSLAATV